MTNYFEKCQHCVPPERHPGCHATCPHYAEAKAKYNSDKAIKDKDKDVWHYCHHKGMQSKDGVAKYIKKRPNQRYHK